MDRKILLYVIGAAVLGFVGFMMLPPPERDDGVLRLPWLVSVDDQGRTQVFGFTIGETTLAEVRQVFGEEGKINLFAQGGDPSSYTVEAYFDRIYLDRLRGDFVFTLEADPREMQAMYGRGLRISQAGSGDKKVTLAPEDNAALADNPIRAITYLPWKSLDADILRKRFGEPAEIRSEATGVVHWLYPKKRMDIALSDDGGVVIQYTNARDFGTISSALSTR